MTVGKPDFNLNSFGIQYKEKNVKYTEDLAKVSAIDGKTTIGRTIPKEEKQTSGGQAADTRLSNGGFERNEPHLRAADAYPKGTTVPVGKKPKRGESGQMGNAAINVNDKEDERGLSYVQPSGQAPKDLKIKAAETVFKAISLKLDLMNKFGKEAAAKREPENTDPDKENQHTLQGFERTQNGQPTVKRQTTGRSMRRVINGKQVKVPSEGGVERKGNERVSTQGDVVNARTASPATVTNAQQMITDNPTTSSGEGTIDPAIASGNSGTVSTWNDGLPATGNSATGGSTSETAATEPSPQDIEDKANNQAGTEFKNSKMGKDQAARRAKREARIIAAGGTVNHAASEINAMTDGMKELFKGLNGSDEGEEADGKTGFTGKVHEKDGTVSNWQNGQHTVRGHGVGTKRRRNVNGEQVPLPREVKTSISEINSMTDGMKELMKDIKPRDYSHGKCVNCGKKMNHQEHMAADHSFNNPKEGEKVCSDCFDKEQ